ncbi:MAG: hypothetical protein L0Z62_05680 [Gemmataceae bacterium]|nr:hypothetical protein [Gemmataceae bacterium]
MKGNTANGLPQDLVSHLDPVRVQEYVRAAGWAHEPRLGKGRLGVYQRPESRLKQLRIPLTRDLSDFPVLMADAVAGIAAWEQRPAPEVLHDLLLPPADVLRFAESGPAADSGDVPLEHGLDLLAGARKVLLAAACSVLRPQSFHPRLSLGEAEQFLRSCRLGQTERSGYVVAIACPLDAVMSPTPLIEGGPFGRQVTTLLMRSVARLAHAVELGAPETALEPAEGEPVLSVNLCEGLLDLTPEGDGSALTISASWARHLPLPGNGAPPPGMVRLPQEAFGRIEALVEKLRPAHAPRRETWVGFVDTLNGRPNADNRMEGQVILRLVDPEHETVRARAELNAEQYPLAWEAHGQNRPVILEGILRREGRLHRLEEVSEFAILNGPQKQ